jgi:CubicO group peptidase (beta-lactamase class C family)
MSPRLLALPVLLAVLGVGLRADAIDDTVTTLMTRRGIPGLSLAVVEDGNIVKARGYGVIETGRTAPVTTDTLFQAASVSKPLAALGALRLVEARRLTLDDDINRTLVSWELPSNQFTREQKVTLRQLLSHSAGLAVHSFPGYATDAPLPTLSQILNGRAPANTLPIRVEFKPGSKWQYSGGGYAIVQQLVFDVTGRPFPDFMRESVLAPLGMTASTFEQPLPPDRLARAATAHNNGRKPLPGRWHIYPELAAAGLWTTPTDLARFIIGLQFAYTGRANPVISREMTQQMLTRQIQDDGLGLFLSGNGPTLRFDHGGRNAGFDTQLVAYAESSHGAVVMINVNDDTGVLTRVIESIADAYNWPDYPHSAPKAIEDAEPAVTDLVKRVFSELPNGRVDRSLFTPEMALFVSQQLAGGARSELKAYGNLRAVVPVGRSIQGNERVYRYRITFENETITAEVTLERNARISGLNFRVE